jgi:hypothetical protein
MNNQSQQIQIKKIFIICPIGAEDSEDRKQSDQLMKYIIEAAVRELQLDCEIIRADRVSEPGRITMQIAREIGVSDLVIADLSRLNANVMYELGVRHGLGKPCILMAHQGQSLPFDLLDLRTIFYEFSLPGAEKASKELQLQIKAVQEGRADVISKTMFSVNPQDSYSTVDNGRNIEYDVLVTLLESAGHVSRELEETKELVRLVGGIVVELRDSKNQENEVKTQEVGMNFLTTMMSQGIQNPEGFKI